MSITERQITDIREKLGRIIRNAELIDAEREEKVQVFSPSTNHRLGLIISLAKDIDEYYKAKGVPQEQTPHCR